MMSLLLIYLIYIFGIVFGQQTCNTVTDDVWDDMCNVNNTNWIYTGNVFSLNNCDTISDCCVGMKGYASQNTIGNPSTLTNQYCISDFNNQIRVSMSISVKFAVDEYISLQYRCGYSQPFHEFKRISYQGTTRDYFTFSIYHKITCTVTDENPFIFNFETKTFNSESYAKISNFEICDGSCDKTKKTVLIIILSVWLGLLCFCLCFCCFVCWDEANEARLAEEREKERKKKYEKKRQELIKQEQRKKQIARNEEYKRLKAEHDKREHDKKKAAKQQTTINIPLQTAQPNIVKTQPPNVITVQPNMVRVQQPNVMYQPIQTVQQPMYGYPQNYVVYNQHQP